MTAVPDIAFMAVVDVELRKRFCTGAVRFIATAVVPLDGRVVSSVVFTGKGEVELAVVVEEEIDGALTAVDDDMVTLVVEWFAPVVVDEAGAEGDVGERVDVDVLEGSVVVPVVVLVAGTA